MLPLRAVRSDGPQGEPHDDDGGSGGRSGRGESAPLQERGCPAAGVMATHDVTRVVASLCAALAGADPEECLRAGLDVLARAGFAPLEPPDAEPGLSARWGGLSVALSSRSPLPPESRELLEAALRLGLARVAEHRLHLQARERMEMLSSASFEGILVNVDGVVVDVNRRLEELLGAGREELLGPDTIRTFVTPQDLPSVLQRVASGFEGVYTIDAVRKDGTPFRAELQSKQGRLGDRPIRVAAVRDVTGRERTLKLLRESESRLRDLVDAAFDVSVLSRDGVVVEVRGPIDRMLGYGPGDVQGRSMLDFVAPSSRPLVARVLAEQRQGAYEVTILDAKGEPVPVEVVGTASTLDGVPIRVAGLRDLREARRLETERRNLERDLAQAQRLESLGVLAGGIAHDFNNLLAGIRGNAELLALRVPDPEARESARAILTAGGKAAGLISQMLAYAGRGSAHSAAPLDVRELVDELRLLLSASLSRQADLVVEVEPGSVVLGDRTTLSQVLMNLLTNASDALDGGRGRIAVRARPLRRPDTRWDHSLGSTVGPGDWVEIEVEDDGVGMDDATRARIFEPFFTTKPKGHGLGLAACLGIVRSHGGALVVESEVGGGSRFSLLLPAAAPAPRAKRPAPEAAPPCRVLVVDDEPIVRRQLRRSLELRGFGVAEAPDGRSGLEMASRGEADVIVLDMIMPDLDGAEVLRALRERGSRVPVVLSSGYMDADSERRLASGSFQVLLSKPYGIDELLEAIERARAAGEGSGERAPG